MPIAKKIARFTIKPEEEYTLPTCYKTLLKVAEMHEIAMKRAETNAKSAYTREKKLASDLLRSKEQVDDLESQIERLTARLERYEANK